MVSLLLTFGLALGAPNPDPLDPAAVAAEAFRISQEIRSHAARGKTAGVDREYERLLGLGVGIEPALHLLAAEVARERGDSLLALARLQRVPMGARAASDAQQTYEQLVSRYGYVRITSVPGVVAAGPSAFAPDEQKAVARMAEKLAENGTFIGLLPAGEYWVGGEKLDVIAGVAVWFPAPPQ